MKSSNLEEELQDSSNSFGFKVMYTFGFGPKPPLEGQLPSSDLPSYGPDGKGLFGIGGISNGIGSQSLMAKAMKQVELFKELIDSCKSFSRISSQPIGPKLDHIGRPDSPFCVKHNPPYLDGGIEQFRKPEWDSVHGNHTNYEIKVPGIKKPLLNIHILLDDE